MEDSGKYKGKRPDAKVSRADCSALLLLELWSGSHLFGEGLFFGLQFFGLRFSGLSGFLLVLFLHEQDGLFFFDTLVAFLVGFVMTVLNGGEFLGHVLLGEVQQKGRYGVAAVCLRPPRTWFR